MKTKCCGTCRHWSYLYTHISGRSEGLCRFTPRPTPIYRDEELVTDPEDGKECGCWKEKVDETLTTVDTQVD